jgi:hypothetical protein
MPSTLEIHLEIHCYNLPGLQVGEHHAVRLGIQKRQEVIEDVFADSEEAIFTVPLRVEFKPTGTANFLGQFVHGNPKEKFIYLCWGERNGGEWDGFSRAKLQLLPLSHTLLFHAADTNTPLKVRINMQDEKGKIICATIKDKQLAW